MNPTYNQLIIILSLLWTCSHTIAQDKIPVFVFTDININSGDPDDRQSLIHLLWYTDELEIKGIIPDRWNARSLEACDLALDAYTRDYDVNNFDQKNYTNPPPSVLYLVDRYHNLDDPTFSSWAGKFNQPFPRSKPNYYTDNNGSIDWNYSNPCSTWWNHEKIQEFAKSTLENERSGMYQSLLNKLNQLYK